MLNRTMIMLAKRERNDTLHDTYSNYLQIAHSTFTILEMQDMCRPKLEKYDIMEIKKRHLHIFHMRTLSIFI